MNIEIEKKDILDIGCVNYNIDGVFVICCDPNTDHIERILLRSILKCFGEQYIITRVDECLLDDDDDEEYIMFTTNLPYEMFEEVRRDV